MNSDLIHRSESKLKGKIVPVYETDYRYRPQRDPEHLICRREFIKFDAPRANGAAAPPEFGGGCFCRVRVREKIKMDSGIQVGEDYIFNVAKEDLEDIIYGSRRVHAETV